MTWYAFAVHGFPDTVLAERVFIPVGGAGDGPGGGRSCSRTRCRWWRPRGRGSAPLQDPGTPTSVKALALAGAGAVSGPALPKRAPRETRRRSRLRGKTSRGAIGRKRCE
ncbi:hypothetical protein [Streptomyces malaysiense]|uniref:hypothetical protein n=1 Tax=Streptomyces malaysiense TaxID=1428626 RepID=UPI0008F691B8|nr:hypothetical protein [Streptomyces malaysiense]